MDSHGGDSRPAPSGWSATPRRHCPRCLPNGGVCCTVQCEGAQNESGSCRYRGGPQTQRGAWAPHPDGKIVLCVELSVSSAPTQSISLFTMPCCCCSTGGKMPLASSRSKSASSSCTKPKAWSKMCFVRAICEPCQAL